MFNPNWSETPSSHHTTSCSESKSTLELQSKVAPSVEYFTTNMVAAQEAIQGEGGWKKTQKPS